ncbi:MAG TPA: ATP-binding cassette domain-containing protein [Gemmatimonadales bacterium]|nr:ATP-binding cassette domain-containing protein [Gemmatimonadales bacterium]
MISDLALYRRLARQAAPMWHLVAGVFLVGLLASPLALLAPLPLKIAVDTVLGPRPLPGFLAALLPAAATRSPSGLLVLVAALAILIALATQLQVAAQKYLTVLAGERLQLDFRARLFRHLQRLSLTYHDTIGTADSVYRIQQDAPAIRSLVIDGFIPLVSSAVTLAGMIYVTILLDWQLALVALAASPPLLLIARAYRPRLRSQSRDVRRLESVALGVVHEVLGALRVVKVFGQEQREGDRFVRRSGDGVRGRVGLALAEGGFSIAIGVITAVSMTIVLFLGISHVRSGLLSLGDLLLVMGYVAKLYDPMKTISRKTATLQGYLASVERAFAVLDERPDVSERADARPIARARGAIAFENVSFAYAPDRPVLHNVSFTIAPGTSIGIEGATGAGKSTLVSLLTRLYDPTAGRILLDGVDLRDYRRDDLRRQFAVVLQESVLFSASIAENIAYADPGASREQIVAAARAANAHEFIERLPRGYDTEVGERGVKLSGGQRQRIALARAFLKDSPVLILDEPTSGVDARTEAAIVEALGRLQQGRTVIIISHRPSAVARCAALLTMARGSIVADTSRAAGPTAPPLGQPAIPGVGSTSARRRDLVLAHPAVQAWQRLNPERPLPDQITPAKFKANKTRSNLTVYRLGGVGAGGAAVIAKRCKLGDGLIERTVYERILPQVHLPAPRYYGAVPDPNDDPAQDVCWLFIGEVEGEKYDMLQPEHRVAAARWLGILQAETASVVDQVELPDAGPSRYREQMRATRDVIQTHIDNPAFTSDDVAFLDRLLAHFEQLDEGWTRIERASTGLPPTLVHGDFNGKNVRVQASPQGARLVAFDWEDAGRGVPAVDLAQVIDPSCRISANPDLASYWSLVRTRWPECDQADVERLAICGAVFRALAVISWDAHHLAHPWANGFLPNLQMYAAELAHALDRLGWTQGWRVAARRAALEGRPA